jgi:ribonuclease HII
VQFVAGIDEAGRGALAGPVVVAAVVLVRGVAVTGARDSKLLTERQRARVYEAILTRGLSIGVGAASPREVDRLNVWRATCLAARRALLKLDVPVQHVLMDGRLMIPNVPIPQTAVVDGDARCLSIALASIVAKVRRDRAMILLGSLHPCYEFHRHKGYGTTQHQDRLRRFGPGDSHRMSFAPLAQMELW